MYKDDIMSIKNTLRELENDAVWHFMDADEVFADNAEFTADNNTREGIRRTFLMTVPHDSKKTVYSDSEESASDFLDAVCGCEKYHEMKKFLSENKNINLFVSSLDMFSSFEKHISEISAFAEENNMEFLNVANEVCTYIKNDIFRNILLPMCMTDSENICCGKYREFMLLLRDYLGSLGFYTPDTIIAGQDFFAAQKKRKYPASYYNFDVCQPPVPSLKGIAAFNCWPPYVIDCAGDENASVFISGMLMVYNKKIP